MGERIHQVDGREEKEYLVQFVEYAEPEWASKVTPTLVAKWEASRPAALAASIARLASDPASIDEPLAAAARGGVSNALPTSRGPPDLPC